MDKLRGPFGWPDPPPRNAETLYEWITRTVYDADQIIEYFDLPPSRLLRMLRGKRLRKKLALQEEIATVLVEQYWRNCMRSVAGRVMALTESPNSEATRKLCENLLRGTALPKRKKRRARGRATTAGAAHRVGREAEGEEVRENPVLRLAQLEQALERAAK